MGALRRAPWLPADHETADAGGVGRYNDFERRIGLLDVAAPGRTRSTARSSAGGRPAGWERSYLGYPTSDEFAIPVAGGSTSSAGTSPGRQTKVVMDRRY